MAEISLAEKQHATEGIVAFMLKEAGVSLDREAVVFIYNNAMEDAVQALQVFAAKNPAYTLALRMAADELRKNFMLVEAESNG